MSLLQSMGVVDKHGSVTKRVLGDVLGCEVMCVMFNDMYRDLYAFTSEIVCCVQNSLKAP